MIKNKLTLCCQRKFMPGAGRLRSIKNHVSNERPHGLRKTWPNSRIHLFATERNM